MTLDGLLGKEYLQILQTLNKWHMKHEKIQIGTLVLVKDELDSYVDGRY